jgi:long-chain acyl-CoA synthetase
MKQSRFITEIMVIGDGQKCLIQPDFEFVKEWAPLFINRHRASNEDIVSNEKVVRIQEEIDGLNEKFEIGRRLNVLN